jgi:toxin ParE1/3/4
VARRLVWSRRASEDLEEIAGYIAQDSEHYARSVIRTILQKSRNLTDFPFIGRIVPELGDESTREIFAYSYRIIYQVLENDVHIVAIIHGQRLLDLALRP